MVSSRQSFSATSEMEFAQNDQIKEKKMEIQRKLKYSHNTEDVSWTLWCTELRKMNFRVDNIFQELCKIIEIMDLILAKLSAYCLPADICVLREDISRYAGAVQQRNDFIGKKLKDILEVDDPGSRALTLLKRYMIGIVIFLHGIIVAAYSPRMSLEGCLNYFSCWVAKKNEILDEMEKVKTDTIKDILEFNCLPNDEKIKVERQMTTLFNSFTSSEDQPRSSAWTAGSQEKKEK